MYAGSILEKTMKNQSMKNQKVTEKTTKKTTAT